jgi:hypothetical protein
MSAHKKTPAKASVYHIFSSSIFVRFHITWIPTFGGIPFEYVGTLISLENRDLVSTLIPPDTGDPSQSPCVLRLNNEPLLLVKAGVSDLSYTIPH